jgi:hypothetical protein
VDLGLYALEWEAVGDVGTSRALDFLLEVHGDSLGRAFVDAMTNESEVTADAGAALEELLRRAETQAAQRLPRPALIHRLLPDLADDPRLAVELDLGDDADLKTFRDFALYSTGAVVFLRDDDEPEIEIYDSGKTFTFFGDDALVGELSGAAGIAPEAIHRVD